MYSGLKTVLVLNAKCNLNENNSQEFWKTIGKIGVGNERQRNIPFEVEVNGQIIRDSKIVLET